MHTALQHFRYCNVQLPALLQGCCLHRDFRVLVCSLRASAIAFRAPRSRFLDCKHRHFHGLNVCKQGIPFLPVSVCSPIKQWIHRLILQTQAATAAHSNRPVPLCLKPHEEAEHFNVLRPDGHRVFPVVLWIKPGSHLGRWLEVGVGGLCQFPKRPVSTALR